MSYLHGTDRVSYRGSHNAAVDATPRTRASSPRATRSARRIAALAGAGGRMLER